MKKHKKILEQIQLEKRLLIQFLNMNDDHSSEFAQGKLDVYNNLINYIQKL
jgi:hypothetical protein